MDLFVINYPKSLFYKSSTRPQAHYSCSFKLQSWQNISDYGAFSFQQRERQIQALQYQDDARLANYV